MAGKARSRAVCSGEPRRVMARIGLAGEAVRVWVVLGCVRLGKVVFGRRG